METNYYNTINMITPGEAPATIAQTLDSWGTRLIQKQQSAFNGRTYTVDPKEKTITEEPAAPQTKLSLWEKIKTVVGLALKKVAAAFDSSIKAKYSLVGSSGMEREALFEKLQPSKKVTVQQQGSNDFDWIAPCMSCIALCFESLVQFILEAAQRSGRH